MFAVATSGRAQLLTANTLTAFDPTYSFNNGVQLTNFGATQTFSNISSITDLTLRFVTESTTSFSTTSMSYAFGSWTGSSPGTPMDVGNFDIADSATWAAAGAYKYLDVTFDLSSVAGSLTPATTYGLSVFRNLAAADFRLAQAIGGDATYADGTGYASPGGFSFGGLDPASPINGDFAFQGAITPVPEASAVSVLFAGLFAGTMVFVRTRRRRVVESAPACA
tara:strand:+ start:72 stop:740 length:669 start_codon:yes stop_codon:yes gene_type:complete